MKTNIYPEIEGNGMRFGIVRARFNDEITGSLVASCITTLMAAGVKEEDINVVEVPGSLEIPYVLGELAQRGSYNALIAIGAVIKGDTPHFDYISKSVTSSLVELSIRYRIPVISGLITTLNQQQAEERAGNGPLNRGAEAGFVALEMVSVRQQRGWV